MWEQLNKIWMFRSFLLALVVMANPPSGPATSTPPGQPERPQNGQTPNTANSPEKAMVHTTNRRMSEYACGGVSGTRQCLVFRELDDPVQRLQEDAAFVQGVVEVE